MMIGIIIGLVLLVIDCVAKDELHLSNSYIVVVIAGFLSYCMNSMLFVCCTLWSLYFDLCQNCCCHNCFLLLHIQLSLRYK